MEIVTLLPLAQAEIAGHASGFLDAVFAGRVPAPGPMLLGKHLVEAVTAGGYPEMHRRTDHARRAARARDYLRAIVEDRQRVVEGKRVALPVDIGGRPLLK